MRFSCKKCNAKYAIADEKIRGKVVKIRCKHCGQVMVVRDAGRLSVPPIETPKAGLTTSAVASSAVAKSELPVSLVPEPALPQSVAPPSDEFSSDGTASNQIDEQGIPPEAGPSQEFAQAFKGLYASGQPRTGPIEQDDGGGRGEPAQRAPVWYYGLDGTEEGPFTSLEIEERIRVGSITRDHFVWREGLDDWTPVEKTFGVAAFLKKLPSETRDTQEPSATDATVDETRKLALSSRADWFEEPLPQTKDDQRLPSAGEPKRDRIEKAVANDQQQKRAEQKRPQAPAPAEDFLADRIASLRDELAEAPVAAVSTTREISTGEHNLRQASERFFESGETRAPPSELLPPSPMVDAGQVAAELHAESLHEEHADSIPPFAEAEHPASSDSAIIRYAGVHSTGRRISMALIGVLFVVMVAGVVLALVLRKDFFNNNQFVSIKSNEELSVAKGEQVTKNNGSGLEETKKIRILLEGEESQPSLGAKPSPELPKPLSATIMRGLVPPEIGHNVFDIGVGEDHQRTKPRIRKEDLGTATAPDVSLDTDMKIDELRGKKIEAAPLLPGRLTGPEKLTDLQIHQVIQKYYAQVKSCQQRQLQRDSSIAGKMIVVARVQPSGSVETVRIDTPNFRGSFVEECLIKEIKTWLFPSFKGEAYDVPFQLQLMARQEISGR